MTDKPTVLVPLRILEGESIPNGVPELLANAHVVLLGYHVVPDQTAPGQARTQFEERAQKRLDEFERILMDAGATVDRRLVFTHEGQKTIDRLIYEYDCLAVLVPNATRPPEDVLVAVRGTVGMERIARVVAGLFAGTDVDITLYHIAAEDETDEDAELLLEGLASRLEEAGVDTDHIEVDIGREESPKEAIVEAANEFDAVVMGESDPSIATFIFGMPAQQVADQFLGPVFVVQRERPPDENGAEESADS